MRPQLYEFKRLTVGEWPRLSGRLINLFNVIEEDEHIYGDVVNINPLFEGLDEEGERNMKKFNAPEG